MPFTMALPAETPHRFTVEQYEEMSRLGLVPENGVELVDGVVVTMAAKHNPHYFAVRELNWQLGALQHTARFHLSIENLSLRLGPYDMPEPDVALEYFDRPGAYERRPLPKEIALIIEVADSSLAYDLGSKRARYAKAGIVEYWVADLVHKRVHVFADPDRRKACYRAERTIDVKPDGARQTLSPAAYPDAKIVLRPIFFPGPP